MNGIRVADLTVRYGATRALDEVSFELRPAAVTGLIGPNGSGKSTLLRALCALDRPSAGTAMVGNLSYASITRPFFRGGAFLDGAGLHPGLTGRQHLAWVAAASRLPDHLIDSALDRVDMRTAADRRIGTYSLGMRQRIGLASCLLSCPPEFILLDEPLNGLDRGGVRLVGDLLKSFAESGSTVLVATHLLDDLAAVADDILLLRQGRLVFHGPIEELTVDQSVVISARLAASERGPLFRQLAAIDFAWVDEPAVGDVAVRIATGDIEATTGAIARCGGAVLAMETMGGLADAYAIAAHSPSRLVDERTAS